LSDRPQQEAARQAAEADADAMLATMQPDLERMRAAYRELGDRYRLGDAQRWVVAASRDG
jgi:hypothetical protein